MRDDDSPEQLHCLHCCSDSRETSDVFTLPVMNHQNDSKLTPRGQCEDGDSWWSTGCSHVPMSHS